MITCIDDIVGKVEKDTGYIFEDFEIRKVLSYSIRKCEINGKGPDYIMVLFENELFDYLVRNQVNNLGFRNSYGNASSTAKI